MIHIILKALWHRKFQNVALVFLLAVSVGLIFSILLIQQGVNSGMETAKQRLGADILVVPLGATVDPGEILYGGAPNNIYMSKSLEPEIAKIAGVKKTTAQFFTQTLTEDCCDIEIPIRLTGYDSQTDWLIQPWLKNISKVNLADDEVIVGSEVNSFERSKVNILGRPFHVVASMEPTGTGLDRSILLDINVSRKLAAESSYLQKFWQQNADPADLISAILVETEDNVDVPATIDKIEKIGSVHAYSAIEAKKHAYEQVATSGLLLLATAIIVSISTIIQLFSRLYALTRERQGEWGLYLALGLTTRSLARLIVTESSILCSLGSVFGLILGYFFYLGSIKIIMMYTAFPFIYPNILIMLKIASEIFLTWLVIGVFASWIPIYRSSRVEPSLVMTRSEFD